MIKPIYNYLCENGTMKFFMTIKSSFFVMISYQIVTLTYDQSYLQLKMLNNGTRESIYDN